MSKQIANVITCLRMLGSIVLVFCPAFSTSFYFVYPFCGVTDMVDGTIARKTNAVSEFGARLDTVADTIFVAVSMYKCLPVMHMPKWIWKWICFIVVIKIGSMMWGIICRKKLISLHTFANRITGLLLFLLPLTFHFIDLHVSVPVVCAVATCAAIQEGYYVWKGREIV